MSSTQADFAADTALEPVEEGLWRGFVDRSWFVVDGPNGGFIAALAARAVQARSGKPPRSLTLHYLEPPVEGPIDVAAVVERAGRTTVSLTLRMTQDDRTVALGLAACAEPREGQPAWHDAEMPEVPDPESCEPWDTEHPKSPAFLRNYEIRSAAMDPTRHPARILWWIRTRDPMALDAAGVAAITDAAVPPAFLRMKQRLFVPTVDLTIHWRSAVPAGAHPWVLGHFFTRVSDGGACEEDGELWSQDGRLIAQSRQLAIVRAPKS